MQCRVVKPDGHARPRRRRNVMGPAVGIGEAEPADGDDSLEKTREQHRDETEERTDLSLSMKWQSKRKTFTARSCVLRA